MSKETITQTTPKQHECETCHVVNDEVYDVHYDAPYSLKERYLCDNCAENEYIKEQERRNEP